MLSTGFIIALILIIVFIGLILVLDRSNLLEPLGFEQSGPFLMWKTKKGRSLIDRIAQKKRFWNVYGNIGVIITAIAMVIILVLVFFNAYLATEIPAEQAPRAQEVLVIPGVNPFIPIGYGILSLAVAMIIHEFSHGILTRVADVKIKSLGIIFLVVPLGAFCEPDEEEIEKTEKMKRDRMFAAGPTSNILLAIVLLLIFSTLFMGSVSAEEDGVMIRGVYEDTPAAEADMRSYEQILEVDGEPITGIDDMDSLRIDITESNDDGETTLRAVDVKVRKGEDHDTYQNVTPGLVVVGILEGSPAQDAGLEPGIVIYRIDGEKIHNSRELSDTLGERGRSEEINLTYWERQNSEYEKKYTNLTLEDGLMGINMGYFGLVYEDAEWFPQMLASPLSGAETGTEMLQNAATYIALPLLGLSPVPEEMTGLYEVSGPLSALPTGTFWIIANSLYWVFWLNILVGLFNALPALPLDGGRLFKDWVASITEKFGATEKIEEKVSTGLTYAMSLSILFLLMWSMIGPRI